MGTNTQIITNTIIYEHFQTTYLHVDILYPERFLYFVYQILVHAHLRWKEHQGSSHMSPWNCFHWNQVLRVCGGVQWLIYTILTFNMHMKGLWINMNICPYIRITAKINTYLWMKLVIHDRKPDLGIYRPVSYMHRVDIIYNEHQHIYKGWTLAWSFRFVVDLFIVIEWQQYIMSPGTEGIQLSTKNFHQVIDTTLRAYYNH